MIASTPPGPEIFRFSAIYLFFAVFADRLNAFAVGLPLLPGFLIFSPDPPLILLRLAWIFEYKPRFAIS
jgi:hypothetical protein